MLTTILGWLTAYPILAYGVWLQLGLALFALVAMPFDKRKILGINPWIKPLKFDLSVLIVFVTIAAMLTGFERYAIARTWIAAGISISLSAENLLISLQSFRGTRSHMNEDTPLDARIWLAMGIGLGVFVVAAVSLLALAFIGHMKWPAAVTWGVRLGLLLFLAGSAEGQPMVNNGGHTIGAPDGVPGLPFLNWSKAFGDLRVAHFLRRALASGVPPSWLAHQPHQSEPTVSGWRNCGWVRRLLNNRVVDVSPGRCRQTATPRLVTNVLSKRGVCECEFS